MRFGEWIKKVDIVTTNLTTAMESRLALRTGMRAGHFREALAELCGLFLEAPAEVAGAFRDLTEEKLNIEASRWVDMFAKDNFRPSLSDSIQANTLLIAGYVRALDRELSEALSPHLGPISNPGEKYRTPSGAAYVVRRLVPLRGHKGQPFRKRGLLFNRVLPSEADGLTVRLLERRTTRKPNETSVFGAALFRDYTIQYIKTENGFILTDINCLDIDDTVQKQIHELFSAGCAIIAWPELMVPTKVRNYITEELGNTALDHHCAEVPDLVVTGTWHEEQEDGTWKNVGHVFNGAGKPLLSFAKANKFYLKTEDDLRQEDISIGNEIHILITDFGTISFCICKDFCDTNFSTFDRLDVDLFVVPSLGNFKTMDGHQTKAKSVSQGSGAKAFIVQQHVDNPPQGVPKPLGWILTRSNFAAPLETLAQDTIWSAYQ